MFRRTLIIVLACAGGLPISTAHAGDTWSQGASAPAGIGGASAAVGSDGRIYVMGGYSNGEVRSVYIYDPSADKWSSAPALPQGIAQAVAASSGTSIYLLGGYGSFSFSKSVYALDLSAQPLAWTTKPSLRNAVADANGAFLRQKVLIAGGVRGNGNATTTSQVYNLSTGHSSPGPTLAFERLNAATNFIGETAILAGGLAGGASTTSVVGTTLGATAFTTLAPLPVPVQATCHGVIRGKLYVMGGFVGSQQSDQATNATEAYDPASNSWTSKATMPQAAGTMASAVVNGKLYCFGGTPTSLSGTFYTTTRIYTP